MRRYDDRYARDVRRHDLALRLIRHGVRTQTIRGWTGLSQRRIWNLYHSYCDEQSDHPAPRRRGPPPQLTRLMASKPLRSEAAALVGLCRELELIPISSPHGTDMWRSLPHGERMCQLFELYQRLIPDTGLELDHLVLLIATLIKGGELELGHCKHCDGAILINLLQTEPAVCMHCRRDNARNAVKGRAQAHGVLLNAAAKELREDGVASGFQRGLFDAQS